MCVCVCMCNNKLVHIIEEENGVNIGSLGFVLEN